MKDIIIKAYGKINLNLLVTGKRSDGYHNIKSIFQRISLFDEIHITKTQTSGIEILSNVDTIINENNTICKTYELLKEQFGVSGVNVELTNTIPMQAGLGGGSADSAGFIIGMNKLFDLNMTQKDMENIAKRIGADVVPCLYNGAMIAEGIGDIITPINKNLNMSIVIIKPPMSCSTKEMYRKIDELNSDYLTDTTEKIIEGFNSNSIEIVARHLYNQFENVVENKELINTLKEELLNNGALGSLMTGSGSCVYGIFDNFEIANKAYDFLKNKYEVYICKTMF